MMNANGAHIILVQRLSDRRITFIAVSHATSDAYAWLMAAVSFWTLFIFLIAVLREATYG